MASQLPVFPSTLLKLSKSLVNAKSGTSPAKTQKHLCSKAQSEDALVAGSRSQSQQPVSVAYTEKKKGESPLPPSLHLSLRHERCSSPSPLICLVPWSTLPLSRFLPIHSALLSILSYGLSASPSHPFLPCAPSLTLLTLVSGHELAPVSHNQGYCFFSPAACRSLALTWLEISQRCRWTVKKITAVIAVLFTPISIPLTLSSVQTSFRFHASYTR